MLAYYAAAMTTIPDLVARLIEMSGGSATAAAKALGCSIPSLSRYKSGETRPRTHVEQRLRALVEDHSNDLFQSPKDYTETARSIQLEDAIAGTLNALREEFHRTSILSKRQDVLDLVSSLMFAHVSAVDAGEQGLGCYLINSKTTAACAVNKFVSSAITRFLLDTKIGGINLEAFFKPLSAQDEPFALAVLRIFDREAATFQGIRAIGREDLINDVFSRFMSASFVDEKEMGQYLTPPEVTRFMVQVGYHSLSKSVKNRLLDPNTCSDAGVVLDPSCGVGSFLAEAVRHLYEQIRISNPNRSEEWLRQFLNRNVFGIDKSERMVRLACINLSLFGTPISNLYLNNSLARVGNEALVVDSLQGRAQLILTNPPFGATYNGPDLHAFKIAKGRNRVDSEILFLERYIDWLAPDGVLVAVVPESILSNKGIFANLRSMIRGRCDVEAVFSLPSVTFSATGTNTKTSILVVRRRKSQDVVKTFFGQVREVGYDVVTRSSQRRRVRHSRSDFPALLSAFVNGQHCEIGSWKRLPADADRWDVGYYLNHDETHNLAGTGTEKPLLVSDVASLTDERQDPKRRAVPYFDYIEISDVDCRTGLVGSKRLPVAEAPSRARKLVRAGDVLVSTVRPERGAIGVVPPNLDGAICSTGFAVLRCRKGMHPVALVWLLKSEKVRRQMIRHNIGIAYPAIAEETCLSMSLPAKSSAMKKLLDAAVHLDRSQVEFEAARLRMLELSDSNDDLLGEVPDLIESGEPRSVSDAA
ncbi:N-6 DNA methylase [Methylobacterium radiotolerans]|uniref:N-6 DNA methylase n=1 Tax=Methylobacterium radiotolerans TaxID=31998 RepID=UPI0015F609DA|nr:N-6 DNA methylase [Methylobacterium radiotolerans]